MHAQPADDLYPPGEAATCKEIYESLGAGGDQGKGGDKK